MFKSILSATAFLAVIILVLAFGSIYAVNHMGADATPDVESAPVVRVIGLSCYGSATPLGGGVFLTCAHVVRDDQTVLLEVPGGRVLAHVERISRADDLALLVVDSEDREDFPRAILVPGIPLADSIPSTGFVVGYPQDAQRRTQGGLAIPSKDHRETFVVCPALAGQSGGPIVDADGRLIGVTRAETSGLLTRYARGASPERIRLFLDGK